ncbi:MAG: restriction endonuclease [Burkholderiales bacterium]|jgi:restriction system protein|nr:restriction endonuclease [Burkholderiales bacterium]
MALRNLFSSIAAKVAFGSRQPKLGPEQWTPELLKRLEWRRFEELCAAYFNALGFRVELAAKGGTISLYSKGAQTISILVQCRPWDAHRVGIKSVHELRGATMSRNIAEGVLVTSGKFTPEARGFASKEKISLIDGAALVDKITTLPAETALELLRFATEGDYQTPTCPACAIKMIKRKSTTHGRAYWGCLNYPACKHTFFIG